MIIGFKEQFKPKILAGTKIHTMREDVHNRWHKGLKMHMATGVRTANYNCFHVGECTGVQRVFMSYDWMLHISITGGSGAFGYAELYYPEKMELALNDGFDSVDEMEDWFIPILEKEPQQCKYFRLIHWTDFKY
ncbi:MAG: hypothetical protein R2800_09960 [Flavipsychrobacter sp.]